MTYTSWITVSEASILCRQTGLQRTSKTIRSWARNGHVDARKKSTATGEMWIIDRASLETKIKTEIEYRDQVRAQVRSSSAPSEPVRTGANKSEAVRTSTVNEHQKTNNTNAFGSLNLSKPTQTERYTSEHNFIRELETEISQLKIDVGWRSKMIEKLTAENDKVAETLHAQARYIGHLESEMLRLGGTPDQTFLKAPKPHSGSHTAHQSISTSTSPEIVSGSSPHPDQTPLYGNGLQS